MYAVLCEAPKNEKVNGMLTCPAPSSALKLKFLVNGVMVPMFGIFEISTHGAVLSSNRYCWAEAEFGRRAADTIAAEMIFRTVFMILNFPIGGDALETLDNVLDSNV
jgi:hypothetical protein